jgi:hypothetical protein
VSKLDELAISVLRAAEEECRSFALRDIKKVLRPLVERIEKLEAERERWKTELKSLITESEAEISEPSEEPGILGKQYLAWCIRQVSVYFQTELKPLRELAKWIKGQPEGVYQISPGEWWWAQVKACEADDVVSLGQYIMDNIPGEPSRSEGAIATAIRIMTTMQAELRTLRELAYLVMNLNMELPERLVSKAREAEEVRSVKAG